MLLAGFGSFYLLGLGMLVLLFVCCFGGEFFCLVLFRFGRIWFRCVAVCARFFV